MTQLTWQRTTSQAPPVGGNHALTISPSGHARVTAAMLDELGTNPRDAEAVAIYCDAPGDRIGFVVYDTTDAAIVPDDAISFGGGASFRISPVLRSLFGVDGSMLDTGVHVPGYQPDDRDAMFVVNQPTLADTLGLEEP